MVVRAWRRIPVSSMVFSAVLLAVAASCGPREGAPAGSAKPSQVVLITIDTLRADHLGCYGRAGARTPHLDALSWESVLYLDAVAAAPITLVSHATLMTGLTPPAHGVRNNGTFRLPDEVETLAERLQQRGFETAAFVGAFVLHHEFGLDQGFGTYDDEMPHGSRSRKFEFEERRAAQVLDRAGAWAVAHKDRPFFLWVHLFDPHAPYDPPAPFRGQPAEHPYDGEIAYVDAELGRFFARLKEAKIQDRSLTIVTSDHGEGLGDHGESTHGLFLYQSTLRVPLIVRGPGGSAVPTRIAEAVGLVDVTPSVVEALGLPWTGPVEGRVLPGFPGLRHGGTLSGRTAPAPAGYYFENLLPHVSFGWAGLRGYRAGHHKIIRAVRTEIYDLATDPGEIRNLLDAAEPLSDPGALDLRSTLDEAVMHAESLAPGGADNPDLSSEAREKLLALGYVASGARRTTALDAGPDPRDMLPFFEGIERAKGLLRDGESEAAIRILETLAATGPGSVGVLGLLGQARMERGEFDAARSILLRARAIDPGDYEIRRRLAEAHYARGDYTGAAAEAREALRLNDRNAESRSILGAALGRLGRHEEAIASFRQAVAQRPEEAALHYNLGLALERASRPGEAEDAYARAVSIDPSSVPSRIALAQCRLRRRDVEGARLQLEEALRADPRSAEALEQLGILLADSGDFRGALERFDAVIGLDPARAQAHWDRGLVLESMGRRDEASAAFRAFLKNWKGDPARAGAARERLRRLTSP